MNEIVVPQLLVEIFFAEIFSVLKFLVGTMYS